MLWSFITLTEHSTNPNFFVTQDSAIINLVNFFQANWAGWVWQLPFYFFFTLKLQVIFFNDLFYEIIFLLYTILFVKDAVLAVKTLNLSYFLHGSSALYD